MTGLACIKPLLAPPRPEVRVHSPTDESLRRTSARAWMRMYGVRLMPWKIDALLAMDGAALAVYAESERKRSSRSTR